MISEVLRKLLKYEDQDIYEVSKYNEDEIDNMLIRIHFNNISDEDIENRFNKIKNEMLKCKRKIDFNYLVFIEIFNLYIVARLCDDIVFNGDVLNEVKRKYKLYQTLEVNEELFINLFERNKGDKDFVEYYGWRKFTFSYGNKMFHELSFIDYKQRYFSRDIIYENLKMLNNLIKDYKSHIEICFKEK